MATVCKTVGRKLYRGSNPLPTTRNEGPGIPGLHFVLQNIDILKACLRVSSWSLAIGDGLVTKLPSAMAVGSSGLTLPQQPIQCVGGVLLKPW